MRRLLSLISLTLFILVFHCEKKPDTQKMEMRGVVNFVSGTARIINADGNAHDAKAGDIVGSGMKLETKGGKSSMEVYSGEVSFKVTGDSLVSVESMMEKIATANKDVRFNVEKGTLFSRIPSKLKEGDSYVVATPTAVASVRGTEFMVSEEDGKSNIACVDGSVSVENSTMPGSQAVVLEKNEEIDVEPGKDMMKRQLSADRLKMVQIVANMKELQADIRKKFEEQREEIKKTIIEQKEKNRQNLEEQKEKDQKLLEEQKSKDKALLNDITGKGSEEISNTVDSAKDEMNQVKADSGEVKEKTKSLMDSVKPDMNQTKPE